MSVGHNEVHETNNTYQEMRALEVIVAFLPSQDFLSEHLAWNWKRELRSFELGDSSKHLTLSHGNSESVVILIVLGDPVDDVQIFLCEENRTATVRMHAITENALTVLRAMLSTAALEMDNSVRD